MRCDSADASGESKRHSSIIVACSEKREKITPLPLNLAPSGDGEPDQILIAVIAPYKLSSAVNLSFASTQSRNRDSPNFKTSVVAWLPKHESKADCVSGA